MFRSYNIFKKIKENNEITSFYLQPTDGNGIEKYKPGQYLPIKVDIPGKNKVFYRTYTLSDRPGKDYYRLTIKKEKDGLVSSYMHESVSEGDVILADSPRGDFYLSKNEKNRHIVLLSGGVGMTPMLSILNHLIHHDTDRDIWFIHGSRHKDGQIQLEKLRRLDESRPNIHIHIHHSNPLEDEKEGYHYDRIGHITPEFLKSFLPINEALFFLCGPPPFMKSLYEGLINWGVTQEHIKYEFFGEGKKLGSKLTISENSSSDTPTVYFNKSNNKMKWDDSFDSILELAESKGLSPPFDCRMGTCTTCESQLISGEVTYEPEPFVEVDEERVLICCSKPKTDVEIDR